MGRGLWFSEDASNSPGFAAPANTTVFRASIGPSGAAVPDTGTRRHGGSEHVDTHHKFAYPIQRT
jgi:hypothetical protein